LQKNPKERLRDAADLRILLQDLAKEQRHPKQPGPQKTALLNPLITFALGFAAAGALLWTLWTFLSASPPDSTPAVRLSVPIPATDQIATLNLDNPILAVSPDGTYLAYVAIRDDTQQLFIRAFSTQETRRVPGTEAASNPFFSPDGQWIAFFAGGKLKKVSIAGSAVQVVTDAPNGRGGCWAADGTIYFAPDIYAGIWKVPAAGGTAQEVTKLGRESSEVSHRWPKLLPGGKTLLFTVWTGPGSDERFVAAQSLQTGERRSLVQGGESATFVATGHLVYARADTLMALPFDAETLTAGGPAVALEDRVRTGSEGAQYAVSDQGTLVYMRGDPRRNERRLVWVDRQGKVEPLPAPPRTYVNPQISPDGKLAAVEVQAGTIGIWLYDFSRAVLTPLILSSSSQSPVWSPDGKRIAYRGTRSGFRNLFWKSADGSGDEERLWPSPNVQTPASWSPDGKSLAYFENADLWILPFADRKARSFVSTPFTEFNAHFSPDGEWIAYSSNESGRLQVYVRPFPGPGTRTQVSTEGGYAPVWSPDGRELFYIRGEEMWVVETTSRPAFRVGTPKLLFKDSFVGGLSNSPGYDVSGDGRRFLRVQALEPDKPATQIEITLNWFEEIKRRLK
jgi:serine/threonine-protein kinase